MSLNVYFGYNTIEVDKLAIFHSPVESKYHRVVLYCGNVGIVTKKIEKYTNSDEVRMWLWVGESFNKSALLIVCLPCEKLTQLSLSQFLQQIPKWWLWLYYTCPTSWTLDGLLTSQYGDIKKEIMVSGETKIVAAFLKDYFGFHHDHLGLVAAVLIIFPLAFASLFVYCIGKLNFQKR